MQTITTSQHRAISGFGEVFGISCLDPSMGTPPAREIAAPLQWHCFALTPTSGTVALQSDAGVVSVTGATVRKSSQYGPANLVGSNLRHLRVWARRKPGTAGTIGAQTVSFGGTASGSLTEMGRIQFGGAVDGAEPVSTVFDQTYLTGHSLFTFDSADPFHIVTGGTDPAVEIVIEMYGEPA